VHDLGQKVGCGAHLSQLRRVSSGKFDVADALTLEKALALSASELGQRIIPFLKLSSME
jgi:tRNA pseudouridine55 synthase